MASNYVDFGFYSVDIEDCPDVVNSYFELLAKVYIVSIFINC